MISGKTRQPSEDAYGGSHAGVPPPTRPRPPQTIPRRSAPCPRYSTRHRRPTPLRISTRPRGAEASTIWSTIYAIRCHQLVRVFRTMPLAARWGKDTAYTKALVRIAALYASKPTFAALPPMNAARRSSGAQNLLSTLWLEAQLATVSGQSTTAGAIRYALSRWEGLIDFPDSSHHI